MGARPNVTDHPYAQSCLPKAHDAPGGEGDWRLVGSSHIAGFLLNYGAPGNCPAGRTAPAASRRYRALTPALAAAVLAMDGIHFDGLAIRSSGTLASSSNLFFCRDRKEHGYQWIKTWRSE